MSTYPPENGWRAAIDHEPPTQSKFTPNLLGDPGMPPAHKGYPDTKPTERELTASEFLARVNLDITSLPMTPEQYEVRGGPAQRNCIPPGPPDKAIGVAETPLAFERQFSAALDDLLKRFGLRNVAPCCYVEFEHTDEPGLVTNWMRIHGVRK